MIFKERTKKLPENVIAFEQVVELGKRNMVHRTMVIDKSDAIALYDFVVGYVYSEEERNQFLDDFSRLDDEASTTATLVTSRRKINRIAEIFLDRVKYGEKTPDDATEVYQALEHVDEVFKFTGGETSYAFKKRMSEAAEKLRLNK